MRFLQIVAIFVWLVGVSVWAAGSGNTSNQVWRSEFMGQACGVLPVERCFVPKVKICGGLGKDQRLLSTLMTVIHHDAIGKRSPRGRLQYSCFAIGGEQFFQRAEWIKGEPLDGAETKALQRLYAKVSGDYVMEIPYMQPGSTMFVGQAEVMKRHVFGWRYDIPGAIRKLEEKNGWKMDVESYGTLPFDGLCRALNKRALPILVSRNDRHGEKRMLLAMGAYSNAVGRYVVCASPADCGLGQKNEFDLAGGDQWSSVLAPPGSAGWNHWQGNLHWMWPDEQEVTLVADLPQGCVILPYEATDWDATVVKDIRPTWEAIQPAMEKLVVTKAATNALGLATPAYKSPDVKFWAQYFSEQATFAVSNGLDLVSGMRCCAAGNGLDPFAVAFATVVFRTHPEGIRLVEAGYEWRRVVQFTCEERWRIMSEKDRKALIAKFNEFQMLSDMDGEYLYGERLWSLDAEGAKQLRAIFAAATNGVVLGPIVTVPGKTAYQQAVERLLPFEGSDPVKSAMARVADRYGWSATVEQMENPSFDALKKAIEMEIPVLVKKSGSGGWAVAVGFLMDSGEQKVLVVEPDQVKPDPRAEDVSREEHEGRMALRADLPGRVKYVKSLAKSKFVVDRLLDTNRELPEGCHFVKMSSRPFAIAYFIHDWKPTICSKEKVAELVAKTKPVDGPEKIPGRK